MKEERKNNTRKYNNNLNKKNNNNEFITSSYSKKNYMNNKKNISANNYSNNREKKELITDKNKLLENNSKILKKERNINKVNDNDNKRKSELKFYKKNNEKVNFNKKDNLTKNISNTKKERKNEHELVKKDKKLNKRNFNKKDSNSNDFIERLNSKLFYILVGAVLCNVCFFIITGGKNYLRLYYELREFIDVYDLVTTEYYGEIDKNEVISNAIDAMFVNINDYYTTYVDKDSADTFLEDVNGTYEGIGCMISTNEKGEIFVVEVFDDSPSSKAGLKKNDIILSVNGEDYSTKTSLDMSEYVKNSNVDKINLTLKREDNIIDVTIERKKIEIPVVSGKVIDYEDKKVGYIDIDVFSSVSYEQIKSKLKKLEKEDISGLVIDVRDNSGGYLSAVTDISSLFLKKGQVIYRLEDEDKSEKIKDETKTSRNYPIAVLVNGSSASASEIFASAIKESYDGFVVGTNTYGKGTVQKTKMLKDGSMVKYTIQKWLTPEGYYLNEVGVTPTHKVEINPELEYDNQLDEALKLIINNEKN